MQPFKPGRRRVVILIGAALVAVFPMYGSPAVAGTAPPAEAVATVAAATAPVMPAAPSDLDNPIPDLASAYVPITPCRVVDTRRVGGRFGNGTQRSWQVSGTCGVPSGATAIEAAVSAVAPKGTGYLRVWPADVSEPNATVVNYAGRGITNTGPIQLSAAGAVRARNLGSASTDVVLDVVGYYLRTTATLPAAASYYVSTPQCRAMDTRATGGPLSAGQQRVQQIGGRCGVPSTATAVIASVSAVTPAGIGFLRVWPAGAAEPTATMVNYAGTSITNSGAVPLSGTGAVAVKNYGATSHVVIDILGYYIPTSAAPRPAGAAFYVPVTPARVADTRKDYANDPPIQPNAVAWFYVANLSGVEVDKQGGTSSPVPAATVGVVASVSVVGPTSSGFVRVWPAGSAEPGTTLINYAGHSITNTTVLVPGRADQVLAHNHSGGATDLVIDVVGYYQVDQRPLTGATAISESGSHACALVQGGRVTCWGRNLYGGLGDGTHTDSNVPVRVVGLTGATAVAAGKDFSCALSADTTVRCWGSNFSGELGNGSTGGASSAPGPVAGLTGATQVVAGSGFACVLLANRTVSCWGYNRTGQLGNGTTTDTDRPGVVPGLTGVLSISAGVSHVCALLTDRTVRCWGSNGWGEVGDGQVAPRHNAKTPTAVIGLTGALGIAAGAYHSCALLTGGTVACWGQDSGEDQFDTSEPYPVAGIRGATALAAGWDSCALLVDRTVSCWESGLAPVAETPVAGATAIARQCALLADTTVACWGDSTDPARGSGPYAKSDTATLVWSGPRW